MSEETKKIKSVPNPTPEVGADVKNDTIDMLIDAITNSYFDASKINSLSDVAQTRENIYSLIDMMSQDSTVTAVLETYTDDICETNDEGQIVWCQASDPKVAACVNFILDSLKINKHIHSWAYSLVKYGDVYVQLFRNSDYEDSLIPKDNHENVEDVNKRLNESLLNEAININIYDKDDKYINYVEQVKNPGSMFDLTKFGKTMMFVKAPAQIQDQFKNNMSYSSLMLYKMNREDINIYPATTFVHAYLEDNSSRTDEEVNIFLNTKDYDNNSNAHNYKVKRGQSILYNQFKIWRQLSLLENSVLLNRVVKSAVARFIQVEVGDMPKAKVDDYLKKIKSLVEQKVAINEGTSYSEYTNPGPIENNIYLAVHNGQGAINSTEIGGNVDVKSLLDLDWFNNKYFAGYRIPKQYFGFTDDAAGFSGGESLALISSRYGKAVKRYQQVMVQLVTDIVNYYLIDRKLYQYINKFKIMMQEPVTKEEVQRRENSSNKIRLVTDVVNILNDVEDKTIRLKLIKNLLSTIITDDEFTTLLQQQIDELKAESEENEEETKDKENNSDNEDDTINMNSKELALDDFESSLDNNTDVVDNEQPNETNEVETTENQPTEQNLDTNELFNSDNNPDNVLPSPTELGLDLSQND